MPRISFRKLLIRFSIAGVIILIGFPLGAFVYLRTQSLPSKVQVKNFQAVINQAAGHDTIIIVGNRKFIIQKGEAAKWTQTYTRNYSGRKDLRFTKALDTYAANLAQKAARDPVNARFTISDAGQPMILTPSQNGQKLDPESAATQIRLGLFADLTEITLQPEIIVPDITAEKISSLGINDRLAVGESNFSGSTLSRIQNIKVSSKRYNGLIIDPNQTFSFNTMLGEVTASTGYAPEKVIKDNKIEYEYGGGICQVSTTLFRAAVLAGFPILERRPHAFPVHYYEPQGMDATVYPGSSDLRFINDTAGPVLIQTHITGKNLIFEIYGQSDGRQVSIDGPHQYDIQPDGSMKAYFVRAISFANGASTSKTFYSTYKSPALFPTSPNPYQ